MTFLRHSGDRHSGRDPQQEEECPEEARELQGRLCQVLRLTFSRETKSERHSRPEEGAERRGGEIPGSQKSSRSSYKDDKKNSSTSNGTKESRPPEPDRYFCIII